MRAVAIAAVVAGCGTTPYDDVVGPFTGRTQRYTLDAIELPHSNTQARDYAGDLNGDNTPDNQLGQVISTLYGEGDATTHAADMVAVGLVPTSIEIIADDLTDDPTVGVRYLGMPDSPFVIVGGRFEDGSFRSNPTARSAVPGEADLVLPVFADADPSLIHAIGVELELEPDGNGGFDAALHAAIPTTLEFQMAVHRGLTQMIASDPGAHRFMMSLLDTSRDGEVSLDEVVHNSLLVSLLAPDVQIGDTRALALGFRAHFRSCNAGTCLDSPPVDPLFDHCFDRVRDLGESDVDCGGGCRGCQAGALCGSAADCDTAGCDGGRCRQPSCIDGFEDGFETGVDCGGGCVGCPVGGGCYVDSDCASGECGEPCTDTSGFGCWDLGTSKDVCYPRP